jgi:hypothetical protein
MALLPSASIINVDPNTLQPQTFSPVDGDIIPNFEINSLFNPQTDIIEFFIYDSNNNLLTSEYNFTGWSLNQESSTTNPGELEVLILDPLNDAINNGYDLGEINLVYNFISNKLGSSNSITYYIDEVSSDRTELRLKSNNTQVDLISSFAEFSSSVLSNNEYFDEFYLNFGDNNYIIGINALLESSSSILIKLYESLLPQFGVDSTCYIVTKTAESVAYNIRFDNVISIIDNTISLRGPNYNIEVKNLGGPTTDYLNKNSILNSPVTTSQYQISSILNTKGVEINADYTDFSTFVHFSSAKKRLENFYYKVKSIEDYQNDLNNILSISGNTQSTFAVSSSKNIIQSQIDNIITNFDGYEYYLYYESSSWAWPKSNNLYPYALESTGSSNVISWYDNIIESASIFDDSNQNNLIYTIPEFIREDSDNINYESFIYMMGQFFDVLWLHTKGITDKLNSDNRLLAGVSKDLVADVIKSLGVETYTNNYALQNLYTAFIGVDSSGSYLPPTGSELITNYIAVNSGSFPYSIDEINKEIYKRLYHNISYILKKKGTVQAIRELANIYGIPPTILRISEFGGRDKLQDTGDYYQDIFNYAYTTDPQNLPAVRIPFSINGSSVTQVSPRTILLRFKAPTFFSNQDYNALPSQSLFYLGIAGGVEGNVTTKPFALTIQYTGSLLSGSYSGSIIDSYYQYGNVTFFLSGSTGTIYSSSVYLPIFNEDWWSIMVRRSNTGIDLFVKNKAYNGFDGNIIGFQASSSIITSDTGSWVTPFTGVSGVGGSPNNRAIIRLGNGLYSYDNKTYSRFSGSFQEFRYYSVPLNEKSFDSYVLNPLSIEGNGLPEIFSAIKSNPTSYNILRFRAPLGADLIGGTSQSLFDNSLAFNDECFDLKSIHPAVTGSMPTQSSWPGGYGTNFITSSSRYLLPTTSSLNVSWSFQPNVETIFIKEPVAGIKNRVTNKIQLEQNIAPGNTLSSLISIQQNNLPQSGTYTSDVNYLEVVFSPQNEINDDISDQLGGFNIGEYISPDEIYGSSSLTYYPALQDLSKDYFKKYIHPYNTWDYIRLIKFYDNSLFKLIKDFVPARTTLSSGILIKQHLLERNRYALPDPNAITTITYVTSASINNIEYNLGNILLTASINSTPGLLDGQKIYSASGDYNSNPILVPEGGTAGVMPDAQSLFGPLGSSSFSGLNLSITQSWSGFNNTVVGLVPFTQSTQDEFYNGEFSGSKLTVTEQRLISEDCEILLYAPTEIISYRPVLFKSSEFSYGFFLDANTAPSASELYLFYDTGSTGLAPYVPPPAPVS